MRRSMSEKVFDVCNVTLMLILVVFTLYPLLYTLFVSFSSPSGYMRHGDGILWHPIGFSLASYRAVFENPNIWNGYRNTLFIVVIGVIINMAMTILGGYVLSRSQLRIRRFLALATMFTMYFNGGMIPTYLNIKNLGMSGSLWALIVPVAINTFNLIIMRTAFENVPKSLEESAMIDGASHLITLVRIMIPLVVPTIAVLVLYYAVGHWNSWFNALLYIRKREMYPLQLILRELIIQDSSLYSQVLSTSGAEDEMISETIKYSTIVVATVPILILYPFLQRYFVKGVMVGAVKG